MLSNCVQWLLMHLAQHPVAIWLKPNSCSRTCKTVPEAWGALVRGPPSPSSGLPLAVQVLGKGSLARPLLFGRGLQAVRPLAVFYKIQQKRDSPLTARSLFFFTSHSYTSLFFFLHQGSLLGLRLSAVRLCYFHLPHPHSRFAALNSPTAVAWFTFTPLKPLVSTSGVAGRLPALPW